MARTLERASTLDLADELVRRLALAGHGGRIELEHDRDQRTLRIRGHSIYGRNELTRFDPPGTVPDVE